MMSYDVTAAEMTSLLLLAMVMSKGDAMADCPEKCLCDAINGIYDCRSAGKTVFPSNLPSPQSVKELLFSGNTVMRIDLLHLMLYKNMRKLDMSSCSLAEIDITAFENAQNLTELRFGDNVITEIEPKTFQGLGQLKYLDLTGNGLSRVPGQIFQDLSKLEKLDLSRNLIESVDPRAFLGLISLEFLDLSVNQIRSVPVDSLSVLPSLRSLSLGGNVITVVPSHAFKSLKNLQKLQLHDNQISALSGLAFHGKDSVELPKLKYLSLRLNKLLTVPVLSLQNLSALVTLDLSDNPIQTLAQESFVGLDRVRQLYLNEMPKLTTIKPYAFSAMPNLEHLQLHTNLKLKSLPSLALGKLPNLKQLNLCCSGLKTLEEDLMEDWNQLQVFDLRMNPWHCDCNLAWLGEYLKNHSSSRIMNSVKCVTPSTLHNTPVLTIEESSCLSVAAASTNPRQTHLSTVLWVMIGCVIGALLVVGLYVMYRYKSKFVKHFHDQMRYRPHEDQTGDSMSSRLSIS